MMYAHPIVQSSIGFFVALIIHELGHAVAWRILGGRIKEIGIGWPEGFGLMRFSFGNFAFGFNPLIPLVGYIKIEDGEKLSRRLSKVERAFGHGAGIVANGMTVVLFTAIAIAFTFLKWNVPWGISYTILASLLLIVTNIFFLDGWKIASIFFRNK